VSLLAELNRRNVLRVAAGYAAVSWLLIQIVGTVFPFFGFSDAAIRGVMIVLIIGFIPAVVVSWVFEWTPEGLRRDGEVEGATPGAVAMGKRLDRLVIVALVLAVGYFAVDKFVFDPAENAAIREQAREEGRAEALVGSYGDKSIAVLPFLNMSSDAEQEYFSDGIAEEVLNLLARIPELRVISRSSAFAFKGQNVEIPEIADRLNVSYVLEGSVRKAGSSVRITAQLIEARSDTHLWSQIYDRDLDDIFAIQEEIAADVVENLKVKLVNTVPRARRTDPEVLALTLQARSLKQIGDTESADRAMALLEKALELDPDYVPALLDLGRALYGRLGRENVAASDIMPKLQAIMVQVSLLEPENARFIAYGAWGQFESAQNIEAAAAGLTRAVELAPNDVDVLNTASEFALRIGHADTAIRLRNRAVSRDPLCFGCVYELAVAYRLAGRYDEALEYQKRYMAMGKGGYYTLASVYLLRGEPEQALSLTEGGLMNDFNVYATRAMALHDLGRFEESAAAMTRQIEEFGDGDFPEFIAEAYAWIGDRDAAFSWLEKTYGDNVTGIMRELMDPLWARVRGDPRRLEWLEKAGFSEERLAAVEFNPVLPD
jgi:TolB-like protein